MLYRHFPTRLELAFAVFEGHWADYEQRMAFGIVVTAVGTSDLRALVAQGLAVAGRLPTLDSGARSSTGSGTECS